MKKVYLDNAATTPVFDEVVDVMMESMKENFGNPSSTHQFGRSAKSLIENSRKNIAKHLNVSSSELIFTSGGTEANNLILRNAILNLGVTKIVTSYLEHHAVLKTVKLLQQEFSIEVVYVDFDTNGTIDIVDLRKKLEGDQKTLVSLMFVNNEIGTILDVKKVAGICSEYKALFHSDAVQAVGHFDIDLQELGVDFISAGAHKFHGPKGVGLAYFKKGFGVQPMLIGGEQEKGARAGTEPVHSILGMDKALEMSLSNLSSDIRNIAILKKYCVALIQKELPNVVFNANSQNIENNTVTVLNMRLPYDLPFVMFTLDLKGVAISGGSACQSGSSTGSHVLEKLLTVDEAMKTSMRISFSKFNTKEEIAYFVEVLKEELLKKN
ncbi:cysteine desulfurase family protein [Flavicella marina]|uniref:cysteine desulfurase family protein n=1 Tax=Flavicella marina TaxID=1475951 RepID=UPI001264A89C|nr:cysteine desulfurase family protein [Flavicella marina]